MNKKYVLKPGRHQFAPGSPASHTNDNLTDDEAEWYINQYPHIISLFEVKGEGPKQSIPAKSKTSADDNPPEPIKSTIADEVFVNDQLVKSTEIGETERSVPMGAAKKTTGE